MRLWHIYFKRFLIVARTLLFLHAFNKLSASVYRVKIPSSRRNTYSRFITLIFDEIMRRMFISVLERFYPSATSLALLTASVIAYLTSTIFFSTSWENSDFTVVFAGSEEASRALECDLLALRLNTFWMWDRYVERCVVSIPSGSMEEYNSN